MAAYRWRKGRHVKRLKDTNKRLFKTNALLADELTNSIAKLDQANSSKTIACTANKRLQNEIETLNAIVSEIKQKRNNQAKQIKDLKQQATDDTTDIDNLRLTLSERSEYIADVEEAIKQRDTEIGLLRMEVESLTLWREKTNQQLRTEADIHAAKSHVLQGRNIDKTLENLTRADQTKNNG